MTEKGAAEQRRASSAYQQVLRFLQDRFNLSDDKASTEDIIEAITRGVEFKGTNLWVLIFAIFIASIGLNVNSTAVVIGAMLISPLMGPIMGIGLGVGTNDFELIKKAVKNLAIATGISILTSTIYFAISPLDAAQSELLARTTPTIWDVLIALFGGIAGIIAATRKEKSNVIPGVAIATALMPPLCTTGFGLAHGNWYFALGAFYLYCINTVFISVSTLLMVKFLKLPQKHLVDSQKESRVKRIIMIVTIVTVLPSLYLAYTIVVRTINEENARLFVQREFNFQTSQVVNTKMSFGGGKQVVEVFLIGKPLDKSKIDDLKARMAAYQLEDVQLLVRQGVDSETRLDINTVKTGLLEDLYKRNEKAMENKDKRIEYLENELLLYKSQALPSDDIVAELKALQPKITEFTINRNLVYRPKENAVDTAIVACISFEGRLKQTDKKKIEEWLKARTKSDKVVIVSNK